MTESIFPILAFRYKQKRLRISASAWTVADEERNKNMISESK